MTPQQLWQSQAAESPRISLAYVRHSAGKLERRTRLRNSVEYGGSLLALAMTAAAAWHHFTARPLMLAGTICTALWLGYYVYAWRRSAAAESAPDEASVLDTLRYQRRQLERQRDVRRHYWRRFGLTLLPACALIVASLILEFDPVRWDLVGFLLGWLVVGLGGGSWFMEYEARRFQRDIDALDSLA